MKDSKIILRETKSLSPISYKSVDATIYQINNQVFISKKDENGKRYETILEKDSSFYKMITGKEVSKQITPTFIHLYISNRCNLSCNICYEKGDNVEEPSLQEIQEALNKSEASNVALIGKEPTCRNDLFDIIKIAKKTKTVILITNGMKLQDANYTKNLKKTGLDYILFSFNGFSDVIYNKMNGHPLSDKKLKALENIKRNRIKTKISTTLVRGVNDDQVLGLFNYCFDNRDFVDELRLRTISPIGKHLADDPYCISELIELVAQTLDVDKGNIMNEYILKKKFIYNMNMFLPKNIRAKIETPNCTYVFHVTRKCGKFNSLDSSMDFEKIDRRFFKPIIYTFLFLKVYGLSYFVEHVLKILRLPVIVKNKNLLMVVLKCWPNVNSIDLCEDKKCSTQYYRNGTLTPFCRSNIVRNRSI